jgi:uncharacterized protein (TIGR02145 family)
MLTLAITFTFNACSGDGDDDNNNGGTSSPSSSPSGGGNSSGSNSGGGSCDMSGYGKVPMPDGNTWMAENLNCDVAGSVCYGGDPANCAKYGRLYTWAAAKTVCPSPWRLPSDAEWEALVTAVGGEETAGTKLKAASPLWDGTDEFGFSALPGGAGSSDGSFGGVGSYGRWWSASESDASYAYDRYMGYSYAYVRRDDIEKTYFISVRCVQD